MIYSIAQKSLEQNIVRVGSRRLLVAGQNQFGSLWTRDFCFASRGLLRLRHFDVVRDQLDAILDARREADDLLPRSLDSVATQMRVFRKVVHTFFPWIPAVRPIGEPLLPEYFNEHGTISIDSNLLVLLASLDYVDATGDDSWWKNRLSDLIKIFRYYDRYRDLDGLVVQPPFSDWQDSVRRSGRTFYTNLIYAVVSERLMDREGFGVDRASVDALRTAIDSVFFDASEGLYRSIENQLPISMDGNLLALDWEYLESGRARALYDSLKNRSLSLTSPLYPSSSVSWTVKAVGLRHYHDRLVWSWILALRLKMAKIFGDHEGASRLFEAFDRMAQRDGLIGEVYQPEADMPLWQSPVFRSEIPFSWGAAFVLDALSPLEVHREPELVRAVHPV